MSFKVWLPLLALAVAIWFIWGAIYREFYGPPSYEEALESVRLLDSAEDYRNYSASLSIPEGHDMVSSFEREEYRSVFQRIMREKLSKSCSVRSLELQVLGADSQTIDLKGVLTTILAPLGVSLLDSSDSGALGTYDNENSTKLTVKYDIEYLWDRYGRAVDLGGTRLPTGHIFSGIETVEGSDSIGYSHQAEPPESVTAQHGTDVDTWKLVELEQAFAGSFRPALATALISECRPIAVAHVYLGMDDADIRTDNDIVLPFADDGELNKLIVDNISDVAPLLVMLEHFNYGTVVNRRNRVGRIVSARKTP